MDRFFRFSGIGRSPFSVFEKKCITIPTTQKEETEEITNYNDIDGLSEKGDAEDAKEIHENESSYGYTRVLTQNKSYNWIVENIRSVRPMSIDARGIPSTEEGFIDIRSKTFSVPIPEAKLLTKWHLYLRFGGCKANETTTHASIWLVLEDNPAPGLKTSSTSLDLDLNSIKATFEIKILNEHDLPQKVHRSGFRSFNINKPKCQPWGFEKFISYGELNNPSSPLLTDNKLRIQLELRLFLGTVNFPLPLKRIKDQTLGNEAPSPTLDSNTLESHSFNFASGDSEPTTSPPTAKPCLIQNNANDMRTAISSLWKDNDFTDVKIIVGDKSFPAHKAILAARSAVFSAMFRGRLFSENQSDEVKIDVFSPEIIEAMLEFIYTDQTNLLTKIENASELLEAAEMYELPALKYDCYVEIVNRLTVENASKIAIIAYYYKPSPDIMAVIKDFFKSNLSDIRLTTGFKELYQYHHSAFSKVLRGDS